MILDKIMPEGSMELIWCVYTIIGRGEHVKQLSLDLGGQTKKIYFEGHFLILAGGVFSHGSYPSNGLQIPGMVFFLHNTI